MLKLLRRSSDEANSSYGHDDVSVISQSDISNDDQSAAHSTVSSVTDTKSMGMHGTRFENDDSKSFKTDISRASQSMRVTIQRVESERKRSVLKTGKKQAREKKIQDFKGDRLRISSLKLHGREREVKTLADCLRSVHSTSTSTSTQPSSNNLPQHQQKSFILLKGYSGVGKTALAKSLKHQVENNYSGLYVYGKYDLYLRDEPYFGIIAACREICASILVVRNINGESQFDDDREDIEGHSFKDIQERLIDKLGVEIYLLHDMIPELEEIVTTTDLIERGIMKPKEDVGACQQENQAKLNNNFRIFLRVVTSFYGPLVMVLDDLQWADLGSLDLIKTILTDRENRNLIMMGLYRSNEVSETHILTKKLSILQEVNRKDPSFDMTEIEVGNLDMEGVKSVTMDLLSLDDTDETGKLSELFYNRTQGNVFFLISFIAMLEEEQLLDYDLNQYRYIWDLDKIQSETAASANVVDLMKAKMSRLPSEYGTMLSVAACLGASFDLDKVEVVWKELDKEERKSGEDKEPRPAMDIMQRLIEEGFVERVKTWNKYRWIHDKVQEAAHALIPDDRLSVFRARVGNIICSHLSAEDLETSLFLVINLLNEATIESIVKEEDRIDLAQLNLRATEKAVVLSAFSSASRYAKKGIELLPEDCWERHYALTLGLYSFAAESAKFLGKDDETRIYCNAILERKDVPIVDKFRVNTVKVTHMCGIQQHEKAGKFMVKILSKFGYKFPRYTAPILLVTVRDIVRVKLREKEYTPEKAATIPLGNNVEQIQVIQYLDRLSNCLFMSGHPLLPVVCLRGALVSDKYGICDASPVMYVTTALVLIVVGDFKGAERTADFALALLNRVPKLSEAAAKFKSGMFVYGWVRPYHFCLKLLLEAYQSGMGTGDIEYAMYAIASYCAIQFTSGKSLHILLDDSRIYGKQASEHKSFVAGGFISTVGQTVLNLMDDSDNTIHLEGEIIQDFQEFWEFSKVNAVGRLSYWACYLRLCSIFEEYDKGADLFTEHGFDWPDENPGHIMYMSNICDGGLCCLEMAKKKTKRRRKYKRFAYKAFATLKAWSKKGNPNVQHYKKLFDAEWAVMGKKYDEAEKCYQRAITTSARGGFIHDAGIASERYMKFLLKERNDRLGAAFQLEKSIEFYDEWGASKKVYMLDQQYASLRTSEVSL